MGISVRNDQQVAFSLSFEDDFGNPVDVLGSVPVWEVSDTDLADVVVSEDGLQATVVPTGLRGTVLVTVVVDTDPSDAYEELVGQAEIKILAGKATVIRMNGVIVDPQVPEDQLEEPTEEEPQDPAEGEGEGAEEEGGEAEEPQDPEEPVEEEGEGEQEPVEDEESGEGEGPVEEDQGEPEQEGPAEGEASTEGGSEEGEGQEGGEDTPSSNVF